MYKNSLGILYSFIWDFCILFIKSEDQRRPSEDVNCEQWRCSCQLSTSHQPLLHASAMSSMTEGLNSSNFTTLTNWPEEDRDTYFSLLHLPGSPQPPTLAYLPVCSLAQVWSVADRKVNAFTRTETLLETCTPQHFWAPRSGEKGNKWSVLSLKNLSEQIKEMFNKGCKGS